MATTLPIPTEQQLAAAYRLANLRRIGIGMARVIETPALYIALRCTAQAMQRKHEASNMENAA